MVPLPLPFMVNANVVVQFMGMGEMRRLQCEQVLLLCVHAQSTVTTDYSVTTDHY